MVVDGLAGVTGTGRGQGPDQGVAVEAGLQRVRTGSGAVISSDWISAQRRDAGFHRAAPHGQQDPDLLDPPVTGLGHRQALGLGEGLLGSRVGVDRVRFPTPPLGAFGPDHLAYRDVGRGEEPREAGAVGVRASRPIKVIGPYEVTNASSRS